MPISFPSSPAPNETYTYGSLTWVWTGSVWRSVGTVLGTQGVQGPQGIQGTQGAGRSISVISTNTSAGSTNGIDYIYVATSALNLTLPTAVGNNSRYTIKNAGIGVVTVSAILSQNIDGQSSLTINSQYASVDLVSNNSNWSII